MIATAIFFSSIFLKSMRVDFAILYDFAVVYYDKNSGNNKYTAAFRALSIKLHSASLVSESTSVLYPFSLFVEGWGVLCP